MKENGGSAGTGQSRRVAVAGPAVVLAAVVLMALCWTAGWTLPFLFSAVVVISIVIWQACDPFADAAQWIGEYYHLPGSVRGATLDAVASSMPELFTGLFFVLVAVAGSEADYAARHQASGEGYGSTIATAAGSAIYNMILIPAVVAIIISFWRQQRPTVDVEDKVIARDGVAFLLCEIVLLWCLYGQKLYWWMGVVFLLMYVAYVLLLYLDWRRFQQIKQVFRRRGLDEPLESVRAELADGGKQFGLSLVKEVREELQRGEDNGNNDIRTAGVLFGFLEVRLSPWKAWLVIATATAAAAAACYFLVEVTLATADRLGVPAFFVAVILAAAASSVPDTLLSVGAAMRGDDSGSVSNAFGSNIFDICICLSVPLLVNSWLLDWEPVSLLQENGEPLVGLVGLQLLLWILTVVTLLILRHNRQLTRRKGIVLCLLYLVFVSYAVIGSLQSAGLL